MNAYDARQRKTDGVSTGIFDYTQARDSAIWPIGYCAGWKRIDRPDYFSDDMWGSHVRWMDEEEASDRLAKYHTNGHFTATEAYECYKAYALDHYLRLTGKDTYRLRKCAHCGEMTHLFAEIGMQQWTLCEKHLSREYVAKLFTVGYSLSSY